MKYPMRIKYLANGKQIINWPMRIKYLFNQWELNTQAASSKALVNYSKKKYWNTQQ